MRTLAFLLAFIAFDASTGEIADAIGVYLPDEDGECGSTELKGVTHVDSKTVGVCIPITTRLDESKKGLIYLAIVELKRPQYLDYAIQKHLSKSKVAEAYEVEIDDYNDEIFELVDGAVLRKESYGYVGYVGYNEDAILYKSQSQWKLCVDGDIYDVEILSEGSKYHYSRDEISGKSIKEIEGISTCE